MASQFCIGDTVEFELAPDGFNSRWPHNGRIDRGQTGKWMRGKVTSIEYQSLGGVMHTVETETKDIYRFLIMYYGGYPASGLRLVRSAKSGGKFRLVERVDKGSKNRYYAVTNTDEDGDRFATELV